jgi:hypothetical protein
LTRNLVSAVIYPYNSDKCNVKKSEIYKNTAIYSYRNSHRNASFSAWVIVGVVG